MQESETNTRFFFFKCDGLTPCITCVKRSTACTYAAGLFGEVDIMDDVRAPRKRRIITVPTPSISDESFEALPPPPASASASSRQLTRPRPRPKPPKTTYVPPPTGARPVAGNSFPLTTGIPLAVPPSLTSPSAPNPREPDKSRYSSGGETSYGSDSSLDEETPVLTAPRMLLDSRGRLCMPLRAFVCLLYLPTSFKLTYLFQYTMETQQPSRTCS